MCAKYAAVPEHNRPRQLDLGARVAVALPGLQHYRGHRASPGRIVHPSPSIWLASITPTCGCSEGELSAVSTSERTTTGVRHMQLDGSACRRRRPQPIRGDDSGCSRSPGQMAARSAVTTSHHHRRSGLGGAAQPSSALQSIQSYLFAPLHGSRPPSEQAGGRPDDGAVADPN